MTNFKGIVRRPRWFFLITSKLQLTELISVSLSCQTENKQVRVPGRGGTGRE